jgi:hypothetical protein
MTARIAITDELPWLTSTRDTLPEGSTAMRSPNCPDMSGTITIAAE